MEQLVTGMAQSVKSVPLWIIIIALWYLGSRIEKLNDILSTMQISMGVIETRINMHIQEPKPTYLLPNMPSKTN